MTEEQIVEEFDISQLKAGKKTDFELENIDEYTGMKVKIEKVYVRTKTTSYDEKGKFVEGLAREVKVCTFETEPINVIGSDKTFTLKGDVNLKVTEEGITWSPHPKSGMVKLFSKYGINRPEQMIGKNVMLIKKVSTATGKGRLAFELN